MIRTLFAESEAATIVSLVWRRSVDGRGEAQAVVEEKEPGWAPPANLWPLCTDFLPYTCFKQGFDFELKSSSFILFAFMRQFNG